MTGILGFLMQGLVQGLGARGPPVRMPPAQSPSEIKWRAETAVTAGLAAASAESPR